MNRTNGATITSRVPKPCVLPSPTTHLPPTAALPLQHTHLPLLLTPSAARRTARNPDTYAPRPPIPYPRGYCCRCSPLPAPLTVAVVIYARAVPPHHHHTTFHTVRRRRACMHVLTHVRCLRRLAGGGKTAWFSVGTIPTTHPLLPRLPLAQPVWPCLHVHGLPHAHSQAWRGADGACLYFGPHTPPLPAFTVAACAIRATRLLRITHAHAPLHALLPIVSNMAYSHI